MIFETERLIVRKWKPSDAAALFEYCGNPEVTKYLTFPTYKSIQDAHDRISDMLKRYKSNSKYNIDYAITIKDSDIAIGSVGLNQFDEMHGRTLEIGYILNPKYQGKGYMTETLVGLFRYIKANDLAWRIIARHDVTNEKSGAVMRRAGMKLEGIARKGASNNVHKRADAATYSI